MKHNELREMVRLIGRADLVHHLEQAEAAEEAARAAVRDRFAAVTKAANEHALARWLAENRTIAAMPVVGKREGAHSAQQVRLSHIKRGFAYVHHIGVMDGSIQHREAIVPVATGAERVNPPRYWAFGRVVVAPECLIPAAPEVEE